MKRSRTGYYKLSDLDRRARRGIMFGPTEYPDERCWLYPDRLLELNSTIIWVPDRKVHIGIESYIDAVRNNDEEAKARMAELGIPVDKEIRFRADGRYGGTYRLDPKRAARGE